ncbi:Type II secretion system protein E [Planctomycetes bacterium CA13]|uniref:Type II secretion system protein E n=1 Tax=Novipirellula herctigrandis TaxID=2527986 RepID=A0A5C5YPL1_9BACT|nr:Type II secretion system protein E [Planctomycetes bacterium CA13]
MNDSNKVDFEEVQTELTPPETYASHLIEWAVERHASDLFVSDLEDVVRISVRRMGHIEPVRRLAREYGRRLQAHLRILGGGDSGDMIRPSEGRGFVTTPSGSVVDLRMSCIPTLFGHDVALRLFDPVRGARSIDSLGYDAVELEAIRKLVRRPSGLILVAGPVASGKSSTLYAIVDELNDGTRKIHTLEDPIEHSIDGVMQSQVNLKLGLDFADLLSVVLRHSPNVIMIGEIRDPRTAAAAVRAGASGQLVLATIHAKTAPDAIDSMMQYEANPKFLASSLIGVLNQRLVRQLCPKCREPVSLPEIKVRPEIIERLGHEPTNQWRAIGCNDCFDDGYQSLTTLTELMLIDDELSEGISSNLPTHEIGRIACAGGMLSLEDMASLRVLRGETTSYEANRVVANPTLAYLAHELA